MKPQKIRQLMNLFEARRPDLEYRDEPDATQVAAVLRSYNSQSYTKLAQKIERIAQLEEEVKAMKEEVKQQTREDIADLFDAEDAVRTRVVETLSFIFTLSKDPKATVAPKYKDILEALSQQLTPELILVLEELKKTMITTTQKAPSLRIRPVSEGAVGNLFTRLKAVVFGWAGRYDQKLDSLKRQAGIR